MKEEFKKLNPLIIEVDDELREHEQFVGITALTLDNGQTAFVGLVEKWETASHASDKRYTNIKAKHLDPTDNTFTKEDLKIAFNNSRGTDETFEEWFDFYIKKK